MNHSLSNQILEAIEMEEESAKNILSSLLGSCLNRVSTMKIDSDGGITLWFNLAYKKEILKRFKKNGVSPPKFIRGKTNLKAKSPSIKEVGESLKLFFSHEDLRRVNLKMRG